MKTYLIKRRGRTVDYTVLKKGKKYNKKLFRGYKKVRAKSLKGAIKKTMSPNKFGF